MTRTILLAFALAYAAPCAAQPQPASISGVVTAALNGAPVAGAVVKLVDEPPATAPPGHQVKSTTTTSDGSFRFDDVEPHAYWVVANLQGYLPAEYGQRSATATGMSFDVAAGQRVNVRLVMWATGVISGRVVDADGEPIGRVQVLGLRVVYRDGKPGLTIAQTVMTNDRGEYRMFWLTPGSYRVAARQWDQETSAPAINIGPPRRFATNEQGTSPVITRRALANGAAVEETYVPIYAPSTPDVQLATPITLGPGDSAAGIDIQMAGDRVPARHVRGIFVRTEDNGRPTLLMMVPRTQTPFASIAPGLTRADGSFDIAGVAPGSYLLYAQDASAIQAIEVGDADVDNVALVQQTGIALKGRIVIDRGASSDVSANPQDFQIQMTREPYLVGAPDGGARFNPAPAPDGAINLNAVAPGDYRVAVRPFGIGPDGETMTGRQAPGPLRNAYMKSVRLGDADVLANGLHLPGPTSQQLEIVIGLNGAEVDGIASDGREPAPNVVIIAVPDGANRGRADLYKRASTDARGHFAMAGLAPGDYTIYAWDDVERGAWESPEFLRGFEGRGRFVRLREGKNDPLELSVVAGR